MYYTRNYALAIASASIRPGSCGHPLGITMGSMDSEPKIIIMNPNISVVTRL